MKNHYHFFIFKSKQKKVLKENNSSRCVVFLIWISEFSKFHSSNSSFFSADHLFIFFQKQPENNKFSAEIIPGRKRKEKFNFGILENLLSLSIWWRDRLPFSYISHFLVTEIASMRKCHLNYQFLNWGFSFVRYWLILKTFFFQFSIT